MKIGKMVSIFVITTLLGTLFTATAVADTLPAPVIVAPSSGFAGYEVEITILFENPDNHFLLYDVQYGDGTWDRGSIWDGSEELVLTHVWDDTGNYDITAQIADVDTCEVSEITVHPISIELGVPAPEIICQRKGFVGEEIEVTLIIDNTLGHYMVYDLQFGDGEFERGGTSEQGIIELTFTHVWESSGRFDITAQLGDVNIGMVSDTTVKPILIREQLSETASLLKSRFNRI